ncbi:MAG: response regulator [Ruminococcus sp.]|nr:response regulator [Ruminococcus sp.]
MEKRKVLIIDDSELNRGILADMLCDKYEVLEACDGSEGIDVIQQYGSELSIILLDLVMPNVNGFDVLQFMNREELINNIPVITISSENNPETMHRSFKLGSTDYITRPYDETIVKNRIHNTIMLYAKQQKLIDIVAEQIYEREKSNDLMINILSHIVEFRNGESGLHVVHIQIITEILLKHLIRKTDKYPLNISDIIMISSASALHDIGKISIPDEILNKPGRFTPEEFAIMKTHSAAGAKMLSQIEIYKDEPLIKFAHEICRWHHERYDGKGYPDGLKGDEIPISAQIVSIADVYDALTSERCHKKAYSHEKAIEMIMNGECGTFNPILLECLVECSDHIRSSLLGETDERRDIISISKEAEYLTKEVLKNENIV